VTVDGALRDRMSQEQLAPGRDEHAAIVFEFLQLDPTRTALENALPPLDVLRRGSRRERFGQATCNLDLVGWLSGVPLGPAHDMVPRTGNVINVRPECALPASRHPDRADRHGGPCALGHADSAAPRRRVRTGRRTVIRVSQ
jgi:hypothetical protein